MSVRGSRYRRLPSGRTRVCPLSLGVLTSFSNTGFWGRRISSEVEDDIMAIGDIIEGSRIGDVSKRSVFLNFRKPKCSCACSAKQIEYDTAE